MILGVGTDLVDIRRIERTVQQFGQRFAQRILSNAEQESCANPTPNLLAKRFAAKEACAKACGTGIGKFLSFKDIFIGHTAAGKPTLTICKTALRRIWPRKHPHDIQLDLSITDAYPYVISFVVISLKVLGPPHAT